MPVAKIESLDNEGRGVAHCDGKVVFIEGALPGECVAYSSYRVKPKYEQATLDTIFNESSQRVVPRCKFFGVCGGCSMQHLEFGAQVAVKQRVLEDALWHIARMRPAIVYPPIQGPAWAYRDRARLSVRTTAGKGTLVGFHEKKSSYIAQISHCEILPKVVSDALVPLGALVDSLSIAGRISQVELAMGADRPVLVLRHLEPLREADVGRVREFGKAHGFSMWLQPGSDETAHPLERKDPAFLEYTLPEFGLRLRFRPTDFTQVNVHINRMLMRRAMQLLDPQPGERIADLFCGLGNFSLPIASRGAYVVGVEGSVELTKRAAENAAANGLSRQSEFKMANLFDATERSIAALGRLDKMLIDPPREGAIAVCKALREKDGPRRLVYVSCNPATLARDAAILVTEKAYRLVGAGVANMFPQTSHVESIALFERD